MRGIIPAKTTERVRNRRPTLKAKKVIYQSAAGARGLSIIRGNRVGESEREPNDKKKKKHKKKH